MFINLISDNIELVHFYNRSYLNELSIQSFIILIDFPIHSSLNLEQNDLAMFVIIKIKLYIYSMIRKIHINRIKGKKPV